MLRWCWQSFVWESVKAFIPSSTASISTQAPCSQHRNFIPDVFKILWGSCLTFLSVSALLGFAQQLSVQKLDYFSPHLGQLIKAVDGEHGEQGVCQMGEEASECGQKCKKKFLSLVCSEHRTEWEAGSGKQLVVQLCAVGSSACSHGRALQSVLSVTLGSSLQLPVCLQRPVRTSASAVGRFYLILHVWDKLLHRAILILLYKAFKNRVCHTAVIAKSKQKSEKCQTEKTLIAQLLERFIVYF